MTENRQANLYSPTPRPTHLITDMFYPLSLILLAFHAAATPLTAHARDNSVAITSLEKNVTSTSGIGNVAAAGKLAPFNDIGIGVWRAWQTSSQRSQSL